MEIIIVRHAEPNYTIDSLTAKGKHEAKLLSDRLIKENIDFFYCSPLGRAKKTASYTLKRLTKPCETLDWLREFEGKITEDGKETHCWDRLPSVWTADERHYTSLWNTTELMNQLNVTEEYNRVSEGIDNLLAKHGYVHEGNLFRAVRPGRDKIVLFCHFAVECVILSHLFNMSPMILWHNFVALPSSVTRIITDEREEGIASFRMTCFGDTSHLYKGDEEPSFMARFCECFTDDTRH